MYKWSLSAFLMQDLCSAILALIFLEVDSMYLFEHKQMVKKTARVLEQLAKKNQIKFYTNMSKDTVFILKNLLTCGAPAIFVNAQQ